MGNCCRREAEPVWATVDEYCEKECLQVAGDDSRAPAATTTTLTPSTDKLQRRPQAKVKITKRELEKLMASARVQDVPMDRLFSQLINAVDDDSHGQRSWTPTLHTIAE